MTAAVPNLSRGAIAVPRKCDRYRLMPGNVQRTAEQTNKKQLYY